MKALYVNFETGMIERHYRGARTVRFMNHMRPESILKFRRELRELLETGYAPTWIARNAWVYEKGARIA